MWVETPSNPGLAVLDLAGLAAAAHDAGAEVAADTTLATPLRAPGAGRRRGRRRGQRLEAPDRPRRPLLGYAAAADPARAAELGVADADRAVPGPFEAWLAHRSLATLGVRLERQEATARALAALLGAAPRSRPCAGPGSARS